MVESIYFGHDRAINTFWYWSALRIFYCFTWWQLGLRATWTLSNLGNLDFEHLGWLGLWTPWVTWTLGNLGFGWLGLWGTCALGTLGNLDLPEIFLASAGLSIFLAMGEPYIFFTWGQLLELQSWMTCALGDLCIGWLVLWVTCALGDLGFEHFGKLGLCRPWVTWTLNNLLLNLIIGKLDVLKNLTRAFMAESI